MKRGDEKWRRNSSKRQFSDARQLGCVFQDMTPPKSILRKGTDMPRPIQRVRFTKAIARHTKIRDQNPSLGFICPGEPHEHSPNAPKFEDRSQEETEWQEQGAREAAWKLAKRVLKLKEHQRATFFSPSENRCLPASTLKPAEREFVVDSGASMHMISIKDLNSAELETVTTPMSVAPTLQLAKNVFRLKEHQRAAFFSPSENWCLPASTLKPEEREFVVDSGASMHMISKKDLSNAEIDTLTKSCSPTIVITANGEVQTHEEAIVYVKELVIFLTMKVLENTPAVL